MQITDKPMTKGPGQELVAWLPFENRHAEMGSVLVCVCVYVCAPVSLEIYPPSCMCVCVYVLDPLTQQKQIIFSVY